MTEKEIKKMLLANLEQKQVKAFEQKRPSNRLSVRRYLQLIDTVDDVKRQTKKGGESDD